MSASKDPNLPGDMPDPEVVASAMATMRRSMEHKREETNDDDGDEEKEDVEDLEEDDSVVLTARLLGLSRTISSSEDRFLPLSDGTSFRGALFADRWPCGQGTLVAPRGARPLNPLASVFDGFFDRGRPTRGETRWENGDVYRGEHDRHGRPDGAGTLFFGGCSHAPAPMSDDGGDHDGEDDVTKASWTCPCPQRCSGPRRYEGELEGGMLHGRGRLLFHDGREYSGGFFRNTLAGQGQMRYPDGRVVQGWWDRAWPLHPATHRVEGARLVTPTFTYEGPVVHGYAHGKGGARTWTWRKGGLDGEGQSEVRVQCGDFHFGIFTVPPAAWVRALCIEALCDEVVERAERLRARREEEAAVAAQKEAAARQAVAAEAATTASAEATQSLLAAAMMEETEEEPVMEETEGHAVLRKQATSSLLAAAQGVDDAAATSRQATSSLLAAAETPGGGGVQDELLAAGVVGADSAEGNSSSGGLTSSSSSSDGDDGERPSNDSAQATSALLSL